MKKLFTLFMLSSLFMQTECMESAAAIPGPDESEHECAFNIMTSDDQRVGPIDKDILRQSGTINALLDDCISADGTFPQDFVVPSTISARDFNEVLPHMRYLFENKHLSLEQQRADIQNALADRDTEHLISLVNNANYLDIPLLIDCCITILAPRVLSSPDSINALPIEIVRLIIKKNITNKCLMDTEPLAQYIDQEILTDTLSCIITTENGWCIIHASHDNTIRICDFYGNEISKCKGHEDWVKSICTIQTSDGWRIISSSADKTIRIWDLSGNQLAQCNGHEGWVKSVCAVQTADGWRIISGSRDNTIRIWDMKGNQIAQCDRHTNDVTAVCAIKTSEGWHIISGSRDNTIRIWDLDGKQIIQWDAHKSSVTSVCAIKISDAWRIISGSIDNTIRIWDLSGNLLAQCTGHTNDINAICTVQTADGWRIISGGSDKTIRIWDLDGKQHAQCLGNTDYISSICTVKTEEGCIIISFSHDNTICFWNTLVLFNNLNRINIHQARALIKVLASSDSAQLCRKIKLIL
jgi:WD40 repeat protein